MRRLFAVVGAVALTVFGLPSVAQASEGSIQAAPGAEVVPDSYVVVLKQSRSDTGERVRALAGKHGGTVRSTYTHALQGFAASMSERQAKRMAADPAVAYVQPNVVHRAGGTQPNP